MCTLDIYFVVKELQMFPKQIMMSEVSISNISAIESHWNNTEFDPNY